MTDSFGVCHSGAVGHDGLIVRIGCLLTAVSLLFGHALAQENAPSEGSDELAWAAGASQQMAEPNLGAWILTGSGGEFWCWSDLVLSGEGELLNCLTP